MGRQVRFLVSRNDVSALESFLLNSGAAFVPWLHETSAVAAKANIDPPDGYAVDPWIVRESDLPLVNRRFVEAKGFWIVDRDCLPLVDVLIPKFRSEVVGEGRLHFDSVYPCGGDNVPVPRDFTDWAAGLLKWVRRTYEYDRERGLYVAPDAANRMG